MRKKKPPPPEDTGDVPLWFMTYSDVITLMMTFFILLLTFATSEPERFEQMKISVFGASGASGLVGETPEGIEKDSWSVRVRPRSARLTSRGSEVPPIDRDAPSESLNKGLAGLDQNEERQIVNVLTIVLPANSIGSPTGDLYDFGEHNMKMLANMMRLKSWQATFEISADDQLDRALACMQYMHQKLGIGPQQVAVCHDEFADLNDDNIRIILRNFKQRSHVQTRTQTPEQAQ
ncbi:MAG: flagellar motor protein MotB [Pirellulaceae bacterium]